MYLWRVAFYINLLVQKLKLDVFKEHPFLAKIHQKEFKYGIFPWTNYFDLLIFKRKAIPNWKKIFSKCYRRGSPQIVFGGSKIGSEDWWKCCVTNFGAAILDNEMANYFQSKLPNRRFSRLDDYLGKCSLQDM